MAVRYLPPVYTAVPSGDLLAATLAHTRSYDDVYADAVHALRSYVSARDVVLTDSGTSALAAGLRIAAAIPRMQRPTRDVLVALPAYGCPDLLTAAVAAGVRIILYDLDPRTLMPDWPSVRVCLEQGATVLVVTHMYGRIVDVPSALAIASEYDAVVVEDAAQGAGGEWCGRVAGGIASIAVLSFGRGKGINAGGGGALLLDTAIPEKLRLSQRPLHSVSPGRSISSLISTIGSELLSAPSVYGIPARLPFLRIGSTVYHAPSPERTIAQSSAALLPQALLRQPSIASARRQIQQWYRARLGTYPELMFASEVAECLPGALRTPVRLTAPPSPRLSRLGVARSYPRTLADYPEIGMPLLIGPPIDGARALARVVYTLPTHELVESADLEAIERELSEGGSLDGLTS